MTATLRIDMRPAIARAFDRLRESLPGLLAVSLGDANGLPVAFAGPTAEKEAATAMASLLVTASQRAAQLLGLPRVCELQIDAEGATLLVRPVGDRFVLMAILAAGADREHASLVLQSTSDDLRMLLEDRA